MKINSLTLSKKYISFDEPFTISAKFTLGSSEALKKWTDEDGTWYNWIYACLVLGHEFYQHNNYGYTSWDTGYPLPEDDEAWFTTQNWYSAMLYYDTSQEGDPNEPGFVFSDLLNLAKGASISFTRTTAYIGGFERDHLRDYLSAREGLQWQTDEKRSMPFRLLFTHGGDFTDIMSSTSKAGAPNLYESSDGDLGVFIFERKVPEITNFSIIDTWNGKNKEEAPLDLTNLTPRLTRYGNDVKKYYFKEHPLFIVAKDYSKLSFTSEKIELDPLDPTLTLQKTNLRIWSGKIEGLLNISSADYEKAKVSTLEDYLNLQETDLIKKLNVTPDYTISNLTNDSVISIDSSTLPLPEDRAKSFCYIYEVQDSMGYSTYIIGDFIVEPYTLPKITFGVERISYDLNNKPIINPEGIYAAINLNVELTTFKNDENFANKGKYYLSWTNLDNNSSSIQEHHFNKEFDIKGSSISIPLYNKDNSIRLEAVEFLSGDLSKKEIIEKDEEGNEITRIEFDPKEHQFIYVNSNRFSFQLIVTDEFSYFTKTAELEETSAILNIEVGGVAVGTRHPKPLDSSSPTFLINYPTTFLSPLILTEGIHFGTQLPSSGAQGQIFYLLIDD